MEETNMFKKWLMIVALVMALPLALAACGGETVEVERVVTVTEVVTEVVEREGETVTEVVTEVVTVTEIVTEIVEVERPMEPVTRTGAWVDTVVVIEEPSAPAAVNRLEVGDIDIYAFQVSNPEVANRAAASPAIELERSSGSYNELSFNPTGPVWESTGKLNPFAVARVREAMNYLVDRDFIVQEIYGGLGVPRFHALNTASADYANLADVARALEAKYAYNPDLAAEIIAEEMEALGAELVGGVWNWNGEPVEVSILIRTEDERLAIGDYVGNQLEDIGFTVIRDYKTAAEASPIWISGDPAAGLFHIYTGGWISTAVPRDLADNFAFFYTNTGLASPLWQAYVNDQEFYDLAQALDNSEFTTAEERREMMAMAMEMALKDSYRVWLNDRQSVTPRRAEIRVASDLYGAIAGSWIWAQTLRIGDEIGGSVTIAMPSILTNPWNPPDGSNWIYDAALYRGIGEQGTVPDPFTGLQRPLRIERAEVQVVEGTPMNQTLDWVTLEFVPEIVVPEDAWAAWDAVEQRFLTVAEVYTDTLTAVRKSTVYYPADMFETVTWHDGSPLSLGDFAMAMILTFDRGNADSPIYDPAKAPALNSFLSSFRGVRIVSQDPLIIEHYGTNFSPDAENSVTTWFPAYVQGSGAWHNMTLGIMAEEAGLSAFTSAKADTLEVDQLNFISGPMVQVMKDQLDAAAAEGYIPYAATLGEFISAEEIALRYENLTEWHRRRGHFWLGTGVFYLERAFPVEGTVILQRYSDHPDMADKWAGFSSPKIAEVEVDGPGRITIGSEAVYDIFVTFRGEPYETEDLIEVKYLLFDATGAVAASGNAEVVEDGLWEVVLSSDVTAELAEGSNRLEIVVISFRVAVPAFDSIQFVTAP
jgi:peptide/nickel transport system substrate-binding protein